MHSHLPPDQAPDLIETSTAIPCLRPCSTLPCLTVHYPASANFNSHSLMLSLCVTSAVGYQPKIG